MVCLSSYILNKIIKMINELNQNTITGRCLYFMLLCKNCMELWNNFKKIF